MSGLTNRYRIDLLIDGVYPYDTESVILTEDELLTDTNASSDVLAAIALFREKINQSPTFSTLDVSEGDTRIIISKVA